MRARSASSRRSRSGSPKRAIARNNSSAWSPSSRSSLSIATRRPASRCSRSQYRRSSSSTSPTCSGTRRSASSCRARLIGSLTALFAVGLASHLPRQPHRQLRAGRSRRGARDLRDPPARQRCPGWRARLDDRAPLPGCVPPRADRRDLPRLRRRADDHQPVLPRAATRPHSRDDRPLAAAHRPRAVHAGLVRVQEPRPAHAQPAVRHQGEHRRGVLRRQRPDGLPRRPDRPGRARALHALRACRHRDPGRGRTRRPGVHPRHSCRSRAGDGVGDHDGARLHHGLLAGRRRRLPHRERAGRDRARARARGRRVGAHGQLPAHRRGRDRARCRRAGDHLQHRSRSVRVPGALRDHRHRPAAQPAAARQPGRRPGRVVVAGGAGSAADSDRAQAAADRVGHEHCALRRDRGVRADAAAVAVEQQAVDRDRDRHHRDRRGVTRAAHRLGRAREPRADGVRRDRWRGRCLDHTERGLGPRLGVARRRRRRARSSR